MLRPYGWQIVLIGGSGRIRTHGPSRAFSFQDCCLKPLSHTSKTWPVLQESNPYHCVRSAVSYPLNEGPLYWWKWKESNFHFSPYEGGALPLCYISNLVASDGNDPSTLALSRRCSATELTGQKSVGALTKNRT